MKTIYFWVLGLLLLAAGLTSCSKDEDKNKQIVDEGSHLYFRHSPAEEVSVQGNYDRQETTEPYDLAVHVHSKQKDQSGYSTPQLYYIENDKAIEQQIAAFLDPNGNKYKGIMPEEVYYVTESCKNITMAHYDKNDNFVSDITDKARFYCPEYIGEVYNPDNFGPIGYNLLFDSNKKLLGRIKDGTTISQYLSYHPLVFANAYFVFPDFLMETISKGNYILVKIELDNGVILSAKASFRNDQGTE